MNTLTINISVENAEKFLQNNLSALEKMKEIQRVQVQIVGVSEEKAENLGHIRFLKDNHTNDYEKFDVLLKNTDSRYVLFYNDENTLVVDSIGRLAQMLEKCDENVLIQSIRKNEHTIKEPKSDGKYKITDLIRYALYFGRYIFRTDFLRGIVIHEDEKVWFADKIILSAVRGLNEISFLKCVQGYTDEALEFDVNLYANQFRKSWYCPYFEKFLLPYVRDNKLSEAEQRLIVYMINLRFYLNLNAKDKFVIQDEEIDRFFRLVQEVSTYIEDQYFIEIRKINKFPKIFAYLFLYEKYSGKLEFTTINIDGNTQFNINGIKYDNNCVATNITAMNYERGNLVIDLEVLGSYSFSNIEEEYKIFIDNKEIHWKKTEIYNLIKAFGRTITRPYSIQFTIPVKNLKDGSEISFVAEVDHKKVRNDLRFKNTASRLSQSKWPYYSIDDKIVTYCDDKLVIKKRKKSQILIREMGMIDRILHLRKINLQSWKAVGLRVFYWLTKRKYSKKKNWIFFDKLYKAGDNGEYLFRYCMANCPEVDSYYIINKDSFDYSRLKNEFGGHILEFNSLRQKTVLLNADIIFATHAHVMTFCGFDRFLKKCFRDILDATVVCIQHGLTTQNIAQYQNRLNDNIKMYFCASKYEIQNLERPIYGYEDKNLFLTGCPRYDGLKNQDKKRILISPTWRRNIVITGNAIGSAKEYNPEFKHTKYFEIYNKLITDPRLISAAREKGYKIVFLLHPTLSSQYEDFDTNGYTTIVPAVSDMSYEEMLTSSSLMVTDYSGIQFDFAYMKKPLLYYHPEELPPQYEEGFYKYDTMGFGPIITGYEEMVAALCEYIENECRMKEEYIERVDDFFEYTDHSNCKRIIDEIKKLRKYD